MSMVYIPPGWTPPPVGKRVVDVVARAEEMGKCGQCLDLPDVTFCGKCGRGSDTEEDQRA